MTNNAKQKLTLDQTATYEIKVPGALDENCSDWCRDITIMVENKSDILPVTTLTVAVDQAALHGLLRKLYSLGLPLVSVICIDYALEKDQK